MAWLFFTFLQVFLHQLTWPCRKQRCALHHIVHSSVFSLSFLALRLSYGGLCVRWIRENSCFIAQGFDLIPRSCLSPLRSSSLLGSWSARGCRAVPVDSSTTKCLCDRLSTFAILARLNPDVVSRAISIISFNAEERQKTRLCDMCDLMYRFFWS